MPIRGGFMCQTLIIVFDTVTAWRNKIYIVVEATMVEGNWAMKAQNSPYITHAADLFWHKL